MEGGQKLQAEKPLNNEEKERQIMQIKNDVREFIEKLRSLNKHELYIANSIKRARSILNENIK